MRVGEVRGEGATPVDEARERRRRMEEAILGKDDFLKLLIIRLKTQNPLEPMENEEFIGQLAEFAALEQMQQLNDKFDKFLNATTLMPQVLPLLGRHVVTTVVDEKGNPISDRVSKIRFERGRALITVRNVEIGLEDIKEVSI